MGRRWTEWGGSAAAMDTGSVSTEDSSLAAVAERDGSGMGSAGWMDGL